MSHSMLLSRLVPAVFLSLGLLAVTAYADEEVPLKNPGFEDGEAAWTLTKDDMDLGLSKVTGEAAASGKMGLRVLVPDPEKATTGSGITSDRIKVEAGKTYTLKFKARRNAISGIGVFVFFNTEQNQPADPNSKVFKALPGGTGDWADYVLEGTAPAGTVYASVYIHSWSKQACSVDFDDFSLTMTK